MSMRSQLSDLEKILGNVIWTVSIISPDFKKINYKYNFEMTTSLSGITVFRS